MNSQFDRLDDIAKRMAGGDDESYGVLSTGERLYVVLASNRFDLLNAEKYTFAETIARLARAHKVMRSTQSSAVPVTICERFCANWGFLSCCI